MQQLLILYLVINIYLFDRFFIPLYSNYQCSPRFESIVLPSTTSYSPPSSTKIILSFLLRLIPLALFPLSISCLSASSLPPHIIANEIHCPFFPGTQLANACGLELSLPAGYPCTSFDKGFTADCPF